MVPIPSKDSYYADMASIITTEICEGDTIVPILEEYAPDGNYLYSVVITDLRGNQYYSPVAEGIVKDGEVVELVINPAFVDK